ncbi:MAG: response regulator [Dehalococcoidia bacterium]|nr:response regulator [Dehalococcoidia bacterium]
MLSRAAVTGGCTILIVEDELPLRRLMTMMLEEEGFQVRTAADGAAGLASIEEQGRPDLVLLDLMMPVLDGRGFLREARARGQDLRVVVVSASPEAEDLVREFGCAGHLQKPYDFEGLLRAIALAVA